MVEKRIPGVCELLCGAGQYAHVEELPPSAVPIMAQGAKAQKPKGQTTEMGEVSGNIP